VEERSCLIPTRSRHSRVVNALDRRILVVESEQDLLDAIAFTFRADGYEVVSVLDGESALALARTEDFAIVILAGQLPELPALEISRRLRAQTDLPIVIHAVDDAPTRFQYLEAGASEYLVRPALSQLVRQVRAILDPVV